MSSHEGVLPFGAKVFYQKASELMPDRPQKKGLLFLFVGQGGRS
ncbi:hypothetical protein [Shouchella shacheensis]|nr:hypothetical protein [Shouchella shacheensis]